MTYDPYALGLALLILRVVSPAVVLLGTIFILPLKSTPVSQSEVTAVVVQTRTPRRALILSLLSLASLTFLLDGLTFVVYAVIWKTWPSFTGIEVNAILGIVGFAGLAALGAFKTIKGIDVWSTKRVRGAILLALAMDTTQAVLYGISTDFKNSAPKIPELPFAVSVPALLHLVFPAFRVLLLVPLVFALYNPVVSYVPIPQDEETSESPAATASSLLLPPEAGATASTGLSPVSGKDGYGTFMNGTQTAATTRTNTPAPSQTNLPPPKPKSKLPADKQEVALDPSWSEIWRRLQRISPYLWPSKSKSLQMLGAICIVLLLIGRFINVLIPLTLGRLVSVFEDKDGTSPWPYLFFYVAMRFLQGSGGLPAVRDTLWAPVMQYSDREMSQLSFDHLLNLSLAFHTRRKTGEVLRILDRGAAINHTLELLLFNLLPTVIDIIVALVVFIIKFEWTLALVIFFVMVAYATSSVVLTRWRTKIRRQMNERDIVTRGIHTDCLLNYETVKYFNGEEHEAARYQDAIREYQQLEYKVIVSLNLLNLVQNFIISLGLLVGSMIVALRVTRGQSKASDFVIFITYLAQLYSPLSNLGYMYRSINQSLVDTEKLLKLLAEPTDVNDKPNAPDLVVTAGEVEFENVSFSYDGRTTALNGISFKVPKGSSVALVGESGSGKSTVLRLLYRFYDLHEGDGRILIDGQDIREITQSSLRKAIGVVPQDSVLFNASIDYNIGYGKFGSNREEIEAAAKAAQMHDRIMSFPDGYDTKVGERGVRLSGGEKQRVAIARTLLKNPPILLLDEATSALDTSTERDIQKALQNLVKGRSSLSIAHRLSTIASSDIILVLKDGQIVEQGNHSELLAKGGMFASMWADQIAASEEGVPPSDEGEAKEGRISGYSVEPTDDGVKEEGAPADKAVPASDEPSGQPELSYADVAAKAPADETEQDSTVVSPEEAPAKDPEAAVPVAFPSSPVEDDAADAEIALADGPAPQQTETAVAFPGGDDTASVQAPSLPTSPAPQSPGVTFVSSETPRSGEPDPNTEPKRKRISSQNFQRIARRISISGRRQGSSSIIPNLIPGLKRESSGPAKGDNDSQKGDGSLIRTDSPSTSAQQEEGGSQKKDKKKEKRERKEQKKRGTIG